LLRVQACGEFDATKAGSCFNQVEHLQSLLMHTLLLQLLL
jgi:hypothetical protein